MGDAHLLVASGEGADGAKEGALQQKKCKHLLQFVTAFS